MRHYTNGLPLPDLRLASDNYLIRAEYGVHEKTGEKKRIISRTYDYPRIASISQFIWDAYYEEQKRVVKMKLSKTDEVLKHPVFKIISDSTKFKEYNDGRERALFALIHILKPSYKDKKEELIKFLQEWYRYSSGYTLSDEDISSKVNYHWGRTYNANWINYLNEILEEIKSSSKNL